MKPSPLGVAVWPLDGINLIEASAGTGKTWTICSLYLRLLLERNLTVQQVLVVTFTNAATAELRERIRRRLVELRAYLTTVPAPAADPFVQALTERLLHALRLDRKMLIDSLHLALQSFDEASIFTIHGFCQRALADNPFAAALPMTLELVESDDAEVLATVQDFWRRHVAADCAAADFVRYLHACGDTPQGYANLLKRHLAKPLARIRWPDDIDTHPVISADSVAPAYGLAQASWGAARQQIVELLLSSLPALNGNTYKEQSVHAAAQCWDRIFRDDDPLAAIEDKASLFCATKLAARTNKNRTGPAHDFFHLADEFVRISKTLSESHSRQRARLLRRLFDEAGTELRSLKLARRVVSFDDMLTNLHERLHDPAYPEFAMTQRTRFPVALIDEFQDTDPLQFDIFRTIYGAKESCVFLVGDPKQAIYSFRHADLHTYLRAKQWTQKHWPLAHNQRSSEAVLRALNALFEGNPGAFILPGLQYTRVDYGSKVRKRFLDQTLPRAALQVWSLPDGVGGALHKNQAKRAAFEAAAAEIARLIREGAAGRITLDGEPLRPRDIAILVRSRADGAAMKRVLALLRVGAVEMSRDSIVLAADAQDLERVMAGILSPSRERLVRAALATDLFGYRSSDIDAVSNDETRLLETLSRFDVYRDIWRSRGFGVMYRKLLSDQRVASRMLARSDGERRLTNILHLGEMLNQAAQAQPSPEALLRYFQAARKEGGAGDAAQLRLESDQNLVQIVTVHASKGLEYPIVFCPFLCDGRTSFGGAAPEGAEYHDANLEPVIDFRGEAIAAEEKKRITSQIKSEQAAESVRLLYVALTRAVHRCYLVAGSYGSGQSASIRESTRSMLNWLVAGSGMSIADWFDASLSAPAITAAWNGIGAHAAGAIDIAPLPRAIGTAVDEALLDATTLSTPAPPATVSSGWRMSSYSGLSYGAKSEQSTEDHDARAAARGGTGEIPAGIADDDILRFPRGATAGDCIHALFESVDFTDSTGWERHVDAALRKYPQIIGPSAEPLPHARLARMLRGLVAHVTDATLVPGLQLRSIGRHQRLTELEFTFPVSRLSPIDLNGALKAFGYRVPALTFKDLNGYLRGFIDLVFEHRGQFFIIDWKSNHLGYEAADYSAAPLERAMSEHGYHLQHLLYTVALDRYLQRRLRDYDYETHVGGALYLFVRGVRPQWSDPFTTPGVYFHRPTYEAVRSLNRLLDSAARGALA
jgi:exodeoxyribonuclease V beta subunit